MVKKGVILDNGKTAQSSMALYWKKSRQNSKKPKKQYQLTEEQARDQKAESGYKSWKDYKEKIIQKSLNPKLKAKVIKPRQISEEQEEVNFQQNKKGPQIINIPGFKSRQNIEKKLIYPGNAFLKKQIDQSTNILKVPAGFGTLTPDAISQILKEKKKKKQAEKNKKPTEKPTVQISEDLLMSEYKDPQPKIQPKPQPQQQKPIFKSDILNQIANGNNSVLLKQKVEINSAKIQQIQVSFGQKKEIKSTQMEEEIIKNQTPKKMIGNFKPRSINYGNINK